MGLRDRKSGKRGKFQKWRITRIVATKVGISVRLSEVITKLSTCLDVKLSTLILENQQLTYENNKLLTDLNMKNMQIAALKRKVWDSDNELNQIVHERDWFRTKTKELEKALHQSKLTPSSEKRQNPFFQSP